VSANYIRMGNMVSAYATLIYPATADGSSAAITGLPINTANAEYARQCSVTFSTESTLARMRPFANSNNITLNAAAGTAVTNATMSGDVIYFICIYPAT
jgi:hypothetical protein